MSDVYRYRLTASAVQDMENIAEYVADHLCAKESAFALLNEFEQAILSACRYPLAAPAINDVLLKAKGYRKLIVRNYIVLYIPNHEARAITIMRVVYHAKNYLDEL